MIYILSCVWLDYMVQYFQCKNCVGSSPKTKKCVASFLVPVYITRQAPQGACRFFMPGSGVRAVPLINGSCDANALIRLPFSSSTQLCSSTSGQLPSVRIDQLPCFQKAAVSGLPISCLSYLYGSYCQFRANTRCFSRLGKSFRMGAMRRRALRPFAA